MNVQEVCQRLFDSSSGILAVGIAPWNGHHERKPTSPMALGGAFLGEADPVRPWKDLFLDAFRMWHNADRHRTVDRLTVNFDNVTVLVERHGPWVIVIGTLVGHEVRKSMRRIVKQGFKQLVRMEENKVISLFPAAKGPDPKGPDPKGKGKGKDNLKPG